MSIQTEITPGIITHSEIQDRRPVNVRLPGGIEYAPHIGHHVLTETSYRIGRELLGFDTTQEIDLSDLSRHFRTDTRLFAAEQTLSTPTRYGIVPAGRICNEIIVNGIVGKYSSTYYLPESQDPSLIVTRQFRTSPLINPNVSPHVRGHVGNLNVSINPEKKDLQFCTVLNDGKKTQIPKESLMQKGQSYLYEDENTQFAVVYNDAVRIYVVGKPKNNAAPYSTYVWTQSPFLPFDKKQLSGIQNLLAQSVALAQHAEKGNYDSQCVIGFNIMRELQTFDEWGASSIG